MAEAEVSDSQLHEGETGETRISVWNDISLSVWRWMPKTLQDTRYHRALLYIAHGVTMHMGCQQELAKVLTENGIVVFGHDHVGHGKSGGERVYIEDFDTYVRDVINHVKEYKESYPEKPCFLMGFSMGGLIAARAAEEEKDLFAGVILYAAPLDVNEGCCFRISTQFLAVLFPHVGVTAIPPSSMSSIPEEVERYANDPLVYHGKLKAKWTAEYLKTVQIARRGIKKVKIPALIIHGTLDSIVPIRASEFIKNNISTRDKDLKYEIYEDNFHDVLHDKGQESAQDMIRDWIIGHLD